MNAYRLSELLLSDVIARLAIDTVIRFIIESTERHIFRWYVNGFFERRKRMRKGKKFSIIACVLGISLLLAACQEGNGSDRAQEGGKAQDGNAAEESGEDKGRDAAEEDADGFPGEYTVPEGWVKAEKYSSGEQIFYVEEGHEEDGQPDNISISIGTNRYSADEHEEFREAILRQIMMQIGKQPGVQLYGDGTHTEQGYVVYIFTIEEEQEGIVTKQYYIVGDRRFCLIHLTNFTGSESVDEAARAMADSFVWKE